jgi:protein-L-isoaspartate O-methyltransferase
MPSFARLSAEAGALERDGAAAARSLAAGLALPVADRPDLSQPAEAFARCLAELRSVVRRMRRMVGASARLNKTAEAQALDGIIRLLAHWSSVADAVRDCLAGRVWPLLPESPPRLDLAGVQRDVLAATFTLAHRAVNTAPQDPAAQARGLFADIALDAGEFVAAAHLGYRLCLAQRRPAPLRFLDVGCGGGIKVMIAAEFFDECWGLELDPGYAEAARRNLAAMEVRRGAIAEGDALAYDGYAGYDVIYFYRPIRTDEALMALEARIAGQAAPGTILIAPYSGFRRRAAGLGCPQVAGPVHVSGVTEAAAAAMAAEARRIGPQVAGLAAPPPGGLGWLRPLWLACAANGIRPA